MSIKRPIFKNTIIITNIHTKKKGSPFAFGVLLEPTPRPIFIPHWLVKAYNLTHDDRGCEFQCLFIDQEEDQNPMAIAFIEDDMIRESIETGWYTGRPGMTSFTAMVEEINKA